ncbi:TPA_asm: hypothetical protein [Monoraphidium MELD virus]|nr:TPA_asm: hypothetical protein [Monoraphidium MELD virus]
MEVARLEMEVARLRDEAARLRDVAERLRAPTIAIISMGVEHYEAMASALPAPTAQLLFGVGAACVIDGTTGKWLYISDVGIKMRIVANIPNREMRAALFASYLPSLIIAPFKDNTRVCCDTANEALCVRVDEGFKITEETARDVLTTTFKAAIELLQGPAAPITPDKAASRR